MDHASPDRAAAHGSSTFVCMRPDRLVERSTVADLVLRGGVVWGHPDRVDAIAIHDGRIVALGGDAVALAGPATVVDMAGGAVLPDFGDGHSHRLFAVTVTLGRRLLFWSGAFLWLG